MSAQIPSTMMVKDLLKPSGYDCPEELLDKTFEEATSGGDMDVSTNTDATIDVSTYTEPVEIEPAEGYDATKKVTLTLENIPSGADLESNHAATIDVSTYTEPVEIEPAAGKDGMEKVTVTLSNIPSGGQPLYIWSFEEGGASAILPVGTFNELTVGMKGIGCGASSECMYAGEIKDIESGEATFGNAGGNYSLSLYEDTTVTVFPDLGN